MLPSLLLWADVAHIVSSFSICEWYNMAAVCRIDIDCDLRRRYGRIIEWRHTSDFIFIVPEFEFFIDGLIVEDGIGPKSQFGSVAFVDDHQHRQLLHVQHMPNENLGFVSRRTFGDGNDVEAERLLLHKRSDPEYLSIWTILHKTK